MKLTKSDREAFVTAVMQDVPQIDYQELFQKTVLNDALAQMSKNIRAVYDSDESSVLDFQYYSSPFNSNLSSVSLRGFDGSRVCYKPSFDAQIKIDKIINDNNEQIDKIANLRTKVSSLITACQTLKAAKANLPAELLPYLPLERDPQTTANVPALLGVFDDLVALGFPKSKAGASATA